MHSCLYFTASSNSLINILQQASLPIIASDVCNGADFYAGLITDRMICAGVLAGGIDTCNVSHSCNTITMVSSIQYDLH